MNTAIIILSILLTVTVVLLVAFAMGCYRLDLQKDAEIKQLKAERLDMATSLYWHRECKANHRIFVCLPVPIDERTQEWYEYLKASKATIAVLRNGLKDVIVDCGSGCVPGHSPPDVQNFR